MTESEIETKITLMEEHIERVNKISQELAQHKVVVEFDTLEYNRMDFIFNFLKMRVFKLLKMRVFKLLKD